MGKNRNLYGTTRVYLIENGLEIDENDHHQITRKRVFFDDVLMITRHKYIAWLLVVFLAGMGLIFLLTGISMLTRNDGAGIFFLSRTWSSLTQESGRFMS